MQYLFVITYGRSGSTVLLNLLNAIEGYTIRGGELRHCQPSGQDGQRCCATNRRNRMARQPCAACALVWHSWIRMWISGASVWPSAFAAEFLRPEADTRVLGFKEIRYSADELSDADYAATIDFLATYFPDSRFIFNTRAWAQVAESGWWRYYPNVRAVSELVRSADQRFRPLGRGPGRAGVSDRSRRICRPAGGVPPDARLVGRGDVRRRCWPRSPRRS